MPEDTIGNYHLLGELGRGGMGIIYKAEQISLGRFVALKVLYPHLVSDPITVKRFNHEARATALLNHPNIVQIFDVGVEEDMHYFAMEYVPGKTLAAVLEVRDRLGVEEAFRIADQTAAALSAAHDVGIIHRDVKPSNILIDDRGNVKVSDFGIAVVAGQGDLTDTGHLMGSVRYMSPEQARGEDLDSRSDLYSLGIVLYEMLAGVPPFDDESPMAVLEKHLNEPVPPLSVDAPPRVQALLLKCLEKRRVDRFRNVREFRVALREAVSEIEWHGLALPPLEPAEEGLGHDPSFRYDRAGVVRSLTDTVSFCVAERLRPGNGLLGRTSRRVADWLGRRVRYRHDSCKMKRLEVLQLREVLARAEQQLEEAKQECDQAHEKYETADAELHEWQMQGSLSLDRGRKFSKEAAALHEKKLWQQLTSYKLQWQSLQDRVRDWYQNVERTRRDYEAAVKELELLKLRRRQLAEKTGVARRNRVKFIVLFALVGGTLGLGWLYRKEWTETYFYHEAKATLVYGRFLTTGMMQEARDEHAAAVLDDGHVLVAGGVGESRTALDSAEIFDRESKSFSPTGGLCEARFNHTMTTLAPTRRGGVLVIGGEQKYESADALRSVELYSRGDGQFVLVSRLRSPRTRHRSVLLSDGNVLVIGGNNEHAEALNTAEILETRTYSSRVVGSRMKSARKDHAVVVLSDGRVVVAGGSQAGNQPLDGVEVFDPRTERFEEVCTMQHARYEHTATAVDADHVVVIGGRKSQSATDALDSVELIDLKEKRSTVIGKLQLPRRVHTTTALPGSDPTRLLIVGGAVGEAGRRNLCEMFSIGWRKTQEAGWLEHDRNNHTVTLLADGSILFTGGYGLNTGKPLRVAELYVKVPASLEPLPEYRPPAAETPAPPK